MLSFHKSYRPLTSRPYLADHLYCEYAPGKQLLPYIACYWAAESKSTAKRLKSREVLVIPDTCIDIIIRINQTKQKVSGRISGIFDQPFTVVESEEQDDVTQFAIRFYFWAAHPLLGINIMDVRNQTIDLEEIDSKWSQFLEPFLYISKTQKRIDYAEDFFLKKLETIDLNANLFNFIDQMIVSPGQKNVRDICASTVISQRQIERLFMQNIGMSPKRMINLVRYQRVWHELALSPYFDIQDVVYRHGYTDQAHLLNEFKRFHGTTITQARQIAEANR